MRIVLATGNTDFRLAIQLMLSEEPGLNIIGRASDCEGFTALVKSTYPDLALLDWDLPGGDVASVLHEINSLDLEPKITLIVLGSQQRQRETALKAGADEYIVIGDPPDNLLRTFRRLNVPKV